MPNDETQYTVRCLIGGCTLCICFLIICITMYNLQPDSTRCTGSVIATTPERIKLQGHKTYTLVDEDNRELIKINIGSDPK